MRCCSPLLKNPTLPVVTWHRRSSYFGGSPYDDQGNGIAVDRAGGIYVTGWTQSKRFPTKHPLQASFGGGEYDAFVVKIRP